MPFKMLYLVFVLLPAMHAAAQLVRLKNITGADENSRVIYLGIENKFFINHLAEYTIDAPGAGVVVNKDTVTLLPRTPGNCIIN